MFRPLIIIDSSEVRPGRLDELRTSFADLARFVEENEPRILLYWVCFDDGERHVTVTQIHPDSESAELHMELAGPIFRPFASLLRMSGIDVYGDPNEMLLGRLQAKARMLGSGQVRVHPFSAGFARL